MSDIPIGTMMIGGPCPACGYHHPSLTCTEYKESKERQVRYLLEQLADLGESNASDGSIESYSEIARVIAATTKKSFEDFEPSADWNAALEAAALVIESPHYSWNHGQLEDAPQRIVEVVRSLKRKPSHE